jgi:hypothetical protein
MVTETNTNLCPRTQLPCEAREHCLAIRYMNVDHIKSLDRINAWDVDTMLRRVRLSFLVDILDAALPSPYERFVDEAEQTIEATEQLLGLDCVTDESCRVQEVLGSQGIQGLVELSAPEYNQER